MVAIAIEYTAEEQSHFPIHSGSVLNCRPLPFGYKGYFRDLDTGIYYLGHRYYNPLTGRFLNRDPIGEAGPALRSSLSEAREG